MGRAQVIAWLAAPLLLANASCQNDVDVPPPPAGMTGVMAGPVSPVGSATPTGEGSEPGSGGGSIGNDNGPPLPNAPNVDGGAVDLSGGPQIGGADAGISASGDNSFLTFDAGNQ